MTPVALKGKRVTVVGLGRFGGGIGVTRWLCSQGAEVTVSDQATHDQLKDSVRQLEGLDVTLHLGGHDEADFLQADLLVVSPAIPPQAPLLVQARDAGIEQTTEINLFLERCPAPVVGITGSVGKSTTTSMIGAILSKKYTVHVGGNIGKSLLEDLPKIQNDHVVVLELSSFQLEALPQIGTSPHIALVTNLAPNHLDRHGTMQAYGDAKKNIFRFQDSQDVLILNQADAEVASWKSEAHGMVDFFWPEDEPFELSVCGTHNQTNAQAAWAVARRMGVDRQTAQDALLEFSSLPHRLQLVAQRNSIRYFNDSKCTTPDGAIVALESFPPRTTVLIAGGYDKGTSFDQLGQCIAHRAKALLLIGATTERIQQATQACQDGELPVIETASSLAHAVELASSLAESGDTVLLSPACASYDMFTNYEQRGNEFTRLVREIVGSAEVK